jgi:predicted TIM-barrel fold metal-dependent hydrolase
MNFDMIARLFPNMTIVLAHMGYPYYIEAWSVAHANANIYLDISGSGPWTEGIPIVFNSLGGRSFIPVDFKRVLWGSDNCLTQAEHMDRSDVYLRQMGSTSQERKLIFGETARKLLKID